MGVLGIEVLAPRRDAHAECLADARHRGAQTTQAQETQSGAREIAADGVLPRSPATERALFGDEMTGETENERPRQFHRGLGGARVPHTVMPSEDAASRSMAAFLMPVVTSNRSRGRLDSTAAGNGVRSRMATTMSKGSSAATTVSGDPRCWSNASMSTRLLIERQSAHDTATR